MRLLITGAAGFIGSNFARWWAGTRPDDELIGLDALTYAGEAANLDGTGVPLVRGDIADTDLVEHLLREHGVDVLVNFAAESHNSLAVIDPARFFRTNVMGTV